MTHHIITLIIGLLLIIFSEALARIAVQSQNNAWHYRFGEKEVRASKLAYLLAGFFLAAAPLTSNFALGSVGILAAIGAWKLSTIKSITNAQTRIKVRPSALPPVGNSPVYIVLIVIALAVFATMIVGTFFWGWYR